MNTKEMAFWANVDISSENGCWEWQAGCLTTGYGAGYHSKNNQYRCHRYSYEYFFGKIPDGLMVLHSCDNRKCVRPDHLFLGTAKDNTHDCISKGRFVKGTMHPHSKLTDTEVQTIKDIYKNNNRCGIKTPSDVSYHALARQYGVSPVTIYRIAKGTRYAGGAL